MEKFPWFSSHIGTMEDGIKLINRMYWSISFSEENGQWLVKGGEKVILRANSRDVVDAFLYGMALAYSILPEPVVEHFQQEYGLD